VVVWFVDLDAVRWARQARLRAYIFIFHAVFDNKVEVDVHVNVHVHGCGG
jgi:hypothetical protein